LASLVIVVALGAGTAVWLNLPSRTEIVARGDQTGSITRPTRSALPTGKPEPSGLTEIVTPDASGMSAVGNGKVVIEDPGASAAIRLAAVPREDLVEKSRYGLLPRIGDDGTRPLDAYARPVASSGSLSRVAIVVGGLGVAEGSTTATLDQLPGEVTLAFAPYGEGLKAALARARESGHEVLLQVPLEPYNFPDMNPGPHTLTTRASSNQNLDDLRWLLGRLTNYVGVVNYMGARFTSDVHALSPVLAEIGKRGLLYLDDGSSAQSQAPAAAADRVPFLQADVVLDADTSPEAIDQRLQQLADIAHRRGYAIGTGSAFPSTVARIEAFAAEAEKHGIVLVPITAVLSSGRT
jgi:polysaccharide deacetylase 2 family uncharacterized protein YibQ